ncbi:MAG: hypothetical protein KatS3mg049_2065 [Caldilinea sp.]|nr:MAG: hypothetical protein KatS3mg049_2065 [Caldilinea sp.]
MSQADVAQELVRFGIETGQSHISNIEQGAKLPSVPLLVALAQMFDVSTDYLLGLSDRPRPARIAYASVPGQEVDQLAQLLSLLSEEQRKALLSVAEAYAYRNLVRRLLDQVEAIGGVAALEETLRSLDSSLAPSRDDARGDTA